MEKDLIQTQTDLENKYAKNQTIPRLKEVFESFPGLKSALEKECIDFRFGVMVLVQIYLHKRCNFETLAGCLHRFAPSPAELFSWLQTCVEMDLLDYDLTTQTFVVKWLIDDEIQEELNAFQYPIPMVCLPKEVKSNGTFGYLTFNGSVILNDHHHDEDACLDHINRLNSVRLSRNMDVALLVKNSWKDLDRRKQGETEEEFKRRKRAFEKYDKAAKHVLEILPDVFYLTHRYDKRGRTCAQGYHINYQGNDWNKAVVEFADKEVINDW